VVALYPVFHDAWFNYPRVHVVYSTCRSLGREVLGALLAHEVAHARVHGRSEYYRVLLDPELAGTLGYRRYLEYLHAVSTILKDFQVFRFLVSRGLVDELAVYADYCLRQLDAASNRLEVIKLLAPVYYLYRDLGLSTAPDPRVGEYSSCLEVLREVALEVPHVDVATPIALRRFLELGCAERGTGGPGLGA
jgi:hypothetical protein